MSELITLEPASEPRNTPDESKVEQPSVTEFEQRCQALTVKVKRILESARPELNAIVSQLQATDVASQPTRLNERAMTLIQPLRQQLNALKVEAAEAGAAVSQSYHTIILHDLNNEWTGLSLACGVYDRKISLPSTIQERLPNLINFLIEEYQTRLGAALRELSPTTMPLPIDQIVTITRDQIGSELLTKNRTITIADISDFERTPSVRHPAVVHDVIHELLFNATKAMLARSVGSWIMVDANQAAYGGLDITVRDNGPGIDPHISDPFEPEQSTHDLGLGGGMGLVGLRQRLAATIPGATMRWDKAASAAEGGCVFVIHLPTSEIVEPVTA